MGRHAIGVRVGAIETSVQRKGLPGAKGAGAKRKGTRTVTVTASGTGTEIGTETLTKTGERETLRVNRRPEQPVARAKHTGQLGESRGTRGIFQRLPGLID